VTVNNGSYKFGDPIAVWQSKTDAEDFEVESQLHLWVLWIGCGGGVFALVGGIAMCRAARRGELKVTTSATFE
jgi:hypothetical protein